MAIDTFLVPPIEPKILEEHDGYVLRRDCFGATIKDFTDHTSMPNWVDYLVRTPADLEALVERLEWNDGKGRVPADWDEQVRSIKASGLGCRMHIGSYYGILRNLMGMERLSMMLYDAPAAIKRFNAAYHTVIMRTLERAIQNLKRWERANSNFGIDNQYTRGDKILAWSVFGWSFGWGFVCCFLGVMIWNFISPWGNVGWTKWFFFNNFILAIVIGTVSTIWFTIGGIRDLRRLFRDLARHESNLLDDGRVVGHVSADDVSLVAQVEHTSAPPVPPTEEPHSTENAGD